METARQIENLLYMYAERIDAGDYAGIAELFSRGRIVAEDGTPLATGAEEVKALYDQSTRIYPETGTPLSKHVVTNPIVEIDEDAGTATCRSYYTVLQKTDSLPLQPIITGRYHDTFTKHPDGWFFTERKMIMDQLGDLSQHLLIEVE